MKTIITILISIFIYIPSIYSQTYTPEWAVRFNAGESSYDLPTKMAVDSAGNVYVTGKSWVDGNNYDYSTIKYNTSGVFQWEVRYNGPGNNIDEPTGIAVDKSGNVFVTGYSYGGSSDYDYATIKYNSNGVQQWIDRYNGTADSTDKANSITLDNSGNVFITGESRKSGSGGSSNFDCVTIKYNTSGTRLWTKSFEWRNGDNDYGKFIKCDATGNSFVGGISSVPWIVLKYNTSGTLQWSKVEEPNPSPQTLSSFDIDLNSNAYITGYGSDSGMIIKYSTSGIKEWGVTSYRFGPRSLVIDSSGNLYLTGDVIGSINGFTTTKFNSSGVQQWVQDYNSISVIHNYSISIILDASRNVYVTGYSEFASTFEDFLTFKYNSSGIKQWTSRYYGTAAYYSDQAQSIGVDYAGNVYVTGSSLTVGTEYDYLTLKYPSSLQLNATVLIEGLYNQGVNRLNTKDTLTAYLRNTSFPYAVADSGKAVIDSVNFLCGFCFNRANSGTYYISIKHRNSIETWSKAGGEIFSKSSPTYFNFTNSVLQSYGNNMKLKGSKYCIYSGDVDQDGIIDASDLSRVDNDKTNSVSGYVITDLNGDDFVDAEDLSIVENNLGMGAVTP